MNSEEINSLKQAEKMALDDPQEGKSCGAGRDNGWAFGLALIAVGVIFLVSQLTGFQLQNWWAVFILIPAVSNLGKAWRIYQSEERLGREGRAGLIGGLVLSVIAATFLFNLDWAMVWPVLLIVAGLGALLSGVLDS